MFGATADAPSDGINVQVCSERADTESLSEVNFAPSARGENNGSGLENNGSGIESVAAAAERVLLSESEGEDSCRRPVDDAGDGTEVVGKDEPVRKIVSRI